jgi:hypothetical protein
MTIRTLRSLGVVPLAIADAAALGMAPAITPVLTSGMKTVLAEAKLLDTESWIMGGSGLPIPPPSYLENVSERFINPPAYPDFSGGNPLFDGQPLFPVDKTNPLFTPEGLYPFEGVKELELNPSVAQGVTILDNTITNQIAADNNLVVFGYSQSATISSLEMKNLLALPDDEEPDSSDLSFVLIGDPSNPNGGLLERFGDPSLPPLTIPSLGITFSGATPADTPWDTAIYTREYDGFADFPTYPINLLSDINAVLGIAFIHGHYPELTADQIGTAIELPVSDDYTGNTEYFMIPTQTLPLLLPFESIPMIGKPLVDLLEPDLRILVNLGYGDIEHGWDQGPANVATPFQLFPDVNFNDVMTALSNGAKQGFDAFMSDLSNMTPSSMAEAFAQSGPDTADPASFTDIVNAFSGALAHAYAALLPTADIANALITTLPAYEASLFAQEISSGNLLDAIGLPIAAAFALDSVAVGFEARVIENAASGITDALSGLGLGS